MIREALEAAGMALLALGAFAQLVSSVGMHRFKNFYLRLHAATVGSVWGCVYALFGAGLLALGYEALGAYAPFMAGSAFIGAIVILFLSPAGSHALARAAHKSRVVKVEPCVIDALDPEMCGERP